MRKNWMIIFFIIFMAPAVSELCAQEIVKSEVIQRIDGKDYYLHDVMKGQTLYSISKVYDIAVDELIYENPDAANGLSIGQLIKVPVVSREKRISEDLRKDDFRFIFHIVKKGETLYGIAKIYDITLDDLKRANPNWSDGLKEGQYLKIPMKEAGQEENAAATFSGDIEKVHTVSAGETLFSISRRYELDLATLRLANPGIGKDLRIGQEINIPGKAEKIIEDKAKPKYYEHTVAGSETLYGIAKKYRVSIDSLKDINRGLTENIFPGEVIRIPALINQENYITHEVREKTKLKKLAADYSMSVTDVKDANPSLGSRVSPGETVLIPVGPPPAILPGGGEITTERPEENIADEKPANDSLKCMEGVNMLRQEFKVALMIPLYTEEIRDIDLSEMDGEIDPAKYRPFNFVQFYEGLLLAVSELEREGFKVRLYVYDVDEKVSKTIKVLQDPDLPSMDLIIGPFFSRNFKLVSNFAEMFGISIVNPLTRRAEVLNNPYVFKVKPSRDVQPDLLARFIRKYYAESNIILVRNNSFQFSGMADAIKSSLEQTVPYGVNVSNASLHDIIREYSDADTTIPDGTLYDKINVENRLIRTEQIERSLEDSTFFTNRISEVIYASDSIQGIIRNASLVRNNLIIVLTDNEVFAPEILTSLNDLKDTFNITVVGMPEWELFTNLETDYLIDLNVYFFTDSYYNFNDPKVLSFIARFRDRFKTHPDNYAFEGYDLAAFFMGALGRFGHDFKKCLPYYPRRLLSTSMRFEPAYPSGFENLYWNLCHYKDYRIFKIPDF